MNVQQIRDTLPGLSVCVRRLAASFEPSLESHSNGQLTESAGDQANVVRAYHETYMIGRILFLSAAAYAGYWYIRRSNNKAKQIARGHVDILLPAHPAPESATAVEPVRQPRSPGAQSRAAEPDPGR